MILQINNGFQELSNSLIENIKNESYYVDRNKVYKNKKKYELLLNKLNFLLGKEENFEENFFFLLDKQPEVIELFPILLATRERSIGFFTNGNIEVYNFEKKFFLNKEEINKYYNFVEITGLKDLFINYNIKNLVDYVFGIEVGLDSNARKNRGGTIMENLVERHIRKFCKKTDKQYKEQVTTKRILENRGIKIESDKSSRRFDFGIFDGKKVFLIETNFYGGGGSKLKAVAGEFSYLYNFLNKQEINLFRITDGAGRKTTLRSLEEAYNATQGNIYNLKLLEDGILENIIK